MNSLRIAFLHERYPFGGGEKVTSDIARYLSPRGYEIWVMAGAVDRQRLSAPDLDNIRFIELPSAKIESDRNGEFILGQVRELGLDLLINVGMSKCTGCMERIRRETSCKVIFALHNVPLWEGINRQAYDEQKLRHGSPLQKLAAGLGRVFRGKNAYRKKYTRRYREVYRSCDAFTVLSKAYVGELRQILGLNTDAGHIHVLTNPLLPHAPYNPDKKNQLLYVGRLSHAGKRIDRLIRIWAKLFREFPEWELLIVGEGEEEERLKQLAAGLGVARIRFCGHTPSPDRYYDRAAILCLTSTFEGWGLVLPEAQQAGVIPIAFDCSGGVHEILSPDGRNGILIPPFDMDEYTRRLRELMSDDALRHKMQGNVIRKSEQYALETVGKQWEKTFGLILHNDNLS